ncbi:MAG: bifunctional phosphopantothenoylcysteine decarboxylase/phosphopantothenate--cysteine ligase CoaBC, partial [Candidatus Baumannia cicadellinicola]|nr:bifunctional phosphopantothenoylcysteine decarboxylase/phosphopantothenate--cysteine ligase CoaBC [Candidatus Baumannia cicadellinicola]
MTELTSKKIILGIGGGIAAYKAPEIVRRLRELGAEVRVVMTSAAKAFITPLSLQVVSSNYVANEMLDQSYQAAMKHIQLAKWADFVILAPATADLLARLAAGFANDLLSAICLATPATIAAVPAMNQHMYLAAATQANLTTLRKRGILLWGPDNGSQACGDIGLGRMLDPLVLVEQVRSYFLTSYSLTHLKIMITAGPTREELDPVRFISNYSSGKMGFAIAYAAAARGAQVTLIAGPVNANTPPGVKRI